MAMTSGELDSVPLDRGFKLHARLLVFLLAINVLVALTSGAHRVWGATSELRRIVNTRDVAAANTYDQVSHVLALSEAGLLIVTGVFWLVWQRRLAKAAPPGSLRRSPGWHVGSWFIPLASFVLPLQNVRDLWRAYVRPAVDGLREPVPLWVALWWIAWLLGNFVGRIPFGSSDSQSTLSGFEVAEWWEASSDLMVALAALLGAVLVYRLSAAREL